MQKLGDRKTYIPTDTSPVRTSYDVPLNKDESLSVAGLKTSPNNPKVNYPKHDRELIAAVHALSKKVYVISNQGEQLMPCSKAKARHLLEAGKAVRIMYYPFTIQLTFECENQVQDVSVGIDPGYEFIGFSAIAPTVELIGGDLQLDNKTSGRLKERAMYRRGRRNKLWYRKPRFDNRRKPEGWLPPSVQRRYYTTLKLIRLLCKILPVKKVNYEGGSFDMQKMMNSEIGGVEYQQGDLYQYHNEKAFLMAREHGLCQLCHKEFTKGNSAHIHHCKQRNEQGPDSVKNKAILHEKCHIKLHKKGLKLAALKAYRAPTFMNIINKRIREDMPEIIFTYGYKTFVDRIKLGLEKSHHNDAFVIAGGTDQMRIEATHIRQKRRNNRSLQLNRKGFAPSIRRQRYAIQPKDLVWVGGKKYVVSGSHNKGKNVMVEGSKKSIPVKKVQKVFHFGSFAYDN